MRFYREVLRVVVEGYAFTTEEEYLNGGGRHVRQDFYSSEGIYSIVKYPRSVRVILNYCYNEKKIKYLDLVEDGEKYFIGKILLYNEKEYKYISVGYGEDRRICD